MMDPKSYSIGEIKEKLPPPFNEDGLQIKTWGGVPMGLHRYFFFLSEYCPRI